MTATRAGSLSGGASAATALLVPPRGQARRNLIDTSFILVNPLWSTSSFGESADTSALELSALGAHLALCRGMSGRLFPLQCLGEAMHGFVAPRLVTTLVVVAALLIATISLAA